jgi:BON domain-containing protein
MTPKILAFGGVLLMASASLAQDVKVEQNVNVNVTIVSPKGESPSPKGPPTCDNLPDMVVIKLATDAVVKGRTLKASVMCPHPDITAFQITAQGRWDAVVTLAGTVEEEKQKERAEKLTKKIKGVKQVINNITIRK